MKILLVGGGTGGPVRPLLAVAAEIKKHFPEAKFLLVGTAQGPEAAMAEHEGIEFVSIPAGKLRRYFSFANFLSPFQIAAGFLKSFDILNRFRPDCVFGAGGFVQVPVMWAAWLKGIPVVIHQQDVLPSLANKLCQWCAARITVTFEESMRHFSSGLGFILKKGREDKVVWTGNPFTEKWKEKTREQGLAAFGLASDLPVLLATGGGTGAARLNEIIYQAVPELVKFIQVIHSTGKGKNKFEARDRYKPLEFISNMDDAYAAADVVLGRAGLSTITEVSNLQKVSIIVPMPDSHQESNALALARRRAAMVNREDTLTPEILVKGIRKMLFDRELQQELKENIGKVMPSAAAPKIAKIIEEVARTRY